MPWDPEIEELFESNVGLQRYLGVDAWGNHVYDATVSEEIAHVDDVGESQGPSGQEVDVTLNPRYEWTGTIYMKAIGVRPYDQLLIPQPPATERLPVWVRDVQTLRDWTGPHHQVIRVTGSPPFTSMVYMTEQALREAGAA